MKLHRRKNFFINCGLYPFWNRTAYEVDMRIGFIGAGKVGFSLGKYFLLNKYKISGYFNRNVKEALNAAKFTNSLCFKNLNEIVDKSDILFLTVSDSVISDIWKLISEFNIEDKIICHCSGLLSSSIFSEANKKRCGVCSVHPLLAVSGKYDSYKNLKKAFFTVEGDKFSVEVISEILRKCGNQFKVIEDKSKIKYHLAASISSNLVIALSKISIETLEQCGFSENEAISALAPLMIENVKNIFEKGVKNALTGPVERCDINTIKSHISALENDELIIYKLLSKKLSAIAKEKNSGINYDSLNKILEV